MLALTIKVCVSSYTIGSPELLHSVKPVNNPTGPEQIVKRKNVVGNAHCKSYRRKITSTVALGPTITITWNINCAAQALLMPCGVFIAIHPGGTRFVVGVATVLEHVILHARKADRQRILQRRSIRHRKKKRVDGRPESCYRVV